MRFNEQTIKRIIRKYQDSFKILEEYDKTRKLPFQRKRIDITLSVRTINKLKEMSKVSGKPVSRIIEEKFS